MSHSVTPEDYGYLSELLMEHSGLALGPGKEYLIETRLVPLAQSTGIEGVPSLVNELKKGNRQLIAAVVEAMTTNETSFFRDGKPFDELERILLPQVIEANRHTRKIRIWCAAASTGQEPYSIAMLIAEKFPDLDHWQIEIVGTDLSQDVLRRAEQAVYSQFDVQRGLPIRTLMTHFEQHAKGWQLKQKIRSRVRFQQRNLLEPLHTLGTFDIIFCRNVLIYFDVATKKKVVERMRQLLRADGWLVLGAAETLIGLTAAFQRDPNCRATIYRPAGTPATVG